MEDNSNPVSAYIKIQPKGFEIKTIEIYDSFGRKIIETINNLSLIHI